MSRFKNALPLHIFVRQQQVIRMYREFLKCAKYLPDQALSNDVRKQVKSEFRRNSKINDNLAIRTLVQEANRNLAQLRSMVPIDLISKLSPPSKKEVTRTTSQKSWIEDSKEGDQRGRLGTGWPWEK